MSLWIAVTVSLLIVAPLMVVKAERADSFYEAAYGLAPQVFISVLVTNSHHSLSNFLGYLEGLDYPKDRISLWFQTDHNVDGTAFALQYWCKNVKKHYKSVDCRTDYVWSYPTRDPYSKSVHRAKNKARLRQEALDTALTARADYLLTLDVDCFLVNPNTLHILIEQEKTIIAPVLEAPDGSSNFWMTKNEMGQPVSDELIQPIVERERVGCIQCAVAFGAVLVHLASPYAENLAYHPPHPKFMGPVDDVQQFAFSAQNEGVGMYIINTEVFGYIIPKKRYTNINQASQDFYEFKMNTLTMSPPLVYSKYTQPRKKITTNSALGLDAVYVVSLARRPQHRARMSAILDELGYNFTIFNAIDGKDLNDSYLEEELGISYVDSGLEFYANDGKMRKEEVGHFLSHYTIWKKVLEEKHKTVLVMEDNVDFRPFFAYGLPHVMEEANRVVPSWEYIYLGRHKVDKTAIEPRVQGGRWLVKPSRSYSMLCYLLTYSGAKKLVDANPLRGLLPTDEFINLMHGWPSLKLEQKALSNFPVMSLKAYSAEPTLVQPSHFQGHKSFISDTAPADEMTIIREKQRKNEKTPVDDIPRENIKKKALLRQIESFKNKIARDEL